MPKSRGFTLVELLVSISIIAILSAIGMVVYSRVIREGRDSRRQSDLRAIQSALEQYFADQFYYPIYSSGSSCSPPNGTLRFNCSLKDPTTGNKTYINTVPRDPTGSSSNPGYSYVPTTSSGSACDNSSIATYCTKYCLYARLSNSNPGVGTCPVVSPNNFAVTPP